MLWGTSWYTNCNKGQGMESPLRCEIIIGFHFYGTFGSNLECRVEIAFRKDILYFLRTPFKHVAGPNAMQGRILLPFREKEVFAFLCVTLVKRF